MIRENFLSETSKDVIEISYFDKSHKANFILKCIDDLSNNINLINDVVIFLKKKDIKWVCMPFTLIKDDLEFPENTVWFEHKNTGGVCCHIEDFKRFYVANLNKLLTSKIIYIDTKNSNSNMTRTSEVIKEEDDGWTTVVIKKSKFHLYQLKNDKLEKLQTELNKLTYN